MIEGSANPFGLQIEPRIINEEYKHDYKKKAQKVVSLRTEKNMLGGKPFSQSNGK